MFVNMLILLGILALTVAFGWFTVRALRTKRVWLKIAGGLGAGLLTLVLAAITFMGAKGIAAIYFPGADPAPNLTVEGTAEQVARGEYLVNLSCVGCHGAVDEGGNPTGELPVSGGWNIAAAEGFGFVGDMFVENLTSGGKLADYSDGELFRAIRHGIDQEGRLLGFMPLLPSGQLSDEDTEAIIAYLRSQPAVEQPITTGDRLNFVGMVMFGAGMFGAPEPAAATVTAPPPGITPAYGQYVATFGECRGCHGSDATGAPATSMFPAVPNPRLLVSTLELSEFITMMRTGTKPDGTPFPDTMPWQNAAKMTDNDLAALYTYLTTEP